MVALVYLGHVLQVGGRILSWGVVSGGVLCLETDIGLYLRDIQHVCDL